MPEPTPNTIDQRAEHIWEQRLIQKDIAELATQYGFTQTDLDWLNWDVLPEAIKDHLREIAEKELSHGA